MSINWFFSTCAVLFVWIYRALHAFTNLCPQFFIAMFVHDSHVIIVSHFFSNFFLPSLLESSVFTFSKGKMLLKIQRRTRPIVLLSRSMFTWGIDQNWILSTGNACSWSMDVNQLAWSITMSALALRDHSKFHNESENWGNQSFKTNMPSLNKLKIYGGMVLPY